MIVRLEGKSVLITGAGSGLGRESALLFAEHGAQVMVTDIDGETAESTAAEVRWRGGQAAARALDVRREDDVQRVVSDTVKTFGKLDVLFSNAGIQVPGYPIKDVGQVTEEQWRTTFDVNVLGTFFACKHVVPALKENGGGAIVVTSSATAIASARDLAPYVASKGAINALVRALAVDLGEFGIRINAICPLHGMSPTFYSTGEAAVPGKSGEEMRAWDPSSTGMPLKKQRPPSLRDNAYAALFFATDESEYISGVCMPTTDGGVLAGFYL
ncbi:SDR family NAD(P)-dependent oxidoreductase [Tomitella cavernea]|nr:SDR family oxidoreductase [Tomitella cavernea]